MPAAHSYRTRIFHVETSSLILKSRGSFAYLMPFDALPRLVLYAILSSCWKPYRITVTIKTLFLSIYSVPMKKHRKLLTIPTPEFTVRKWKEADPLHGFQKAIIEQGSHQAKRESARILKQLHCATAMIMQVTGLSAEEIETL